MLMITRKTLWKNLTFNPLIIKNKSTSKRKEFHFTCQPINNNKSTQNYNLKSINIKKERSRNKQEKSNKNKFYNVKSRFSNKKYKNNLNKEISKKESKETKKMFQLKSCLKKTNWTKNYFKTHNKKNKFTFIRMYLWTMKNKEMQIRYVLWWGKT